MASSFKSVSHSLAKTLRPSLRQRTRSSSSERSASSESEDQFVLSMDNTPFNEFPPSAPGPGPSMSITSAPRDGLLLGKLTAHTSTIPELPIFERSKPIPIELPTGRKNSLAPESVPADAVPEPLSARGDIAGGYFPLHEDPKSRVRQPHPFHLDASKARRRSLQRASKTTSQVTAMLEPPRFSPFGSTASNSPGTHTPVSSYIPTGVHDNAALPMGKYYPSNYENRLNSQSRQLPKPAPGVPTRSESEVPKYRQETGHCRSKSEVKRRLLQYQRDMVAQASIAASALIANTSSPSKDAAGHPSKAATLGSLKLPSNFHLGDILSQPHKPVSPRLAPLGSPGPVTPMALEGSADGFLTLGRPITGSNADYQGSARVEGRPDGGRSPAPISV